MAAPAPAPAPTAGAAGALPQSPVTPNTVLSELVDTLKTEQLADTGGSVSRSSRRNPAPKQAQQLWKTWDTKSQKAGERKSVYWVKPRAESYEQKITNQEANNGAGLHKSFKWQTGSVYSGHWQNNKMHGFGTKIWSNGNKYEGEWLNGQREGNGSFWVMDDKKLRKQYAGHWHKDLKEGPGTFYYKTGARYEGEWKNGQRHGTGNLFYPNKDVYVGDWIEDKCSGWGTITYANGDQFEGEWLNGKKEGQGQYFFRKTGKIYDGEWVNDIPKCGVYTHAVFVDEKKQQHAVNPNATTLPQLELLESDRILEHEIDGIQKRRDAARSVPYIDLNQLYSEAELDALRDIFSIADKQGRGFVKAIELKSLLDGVGLMPSDQEVAQLLVDLDKNHKQVVSFTEFVKGVYLLKAEKLPVPAGSGGGSPEADTNSEDAELAAEADVINPADADPLADQDPSTLAEAHAEAAARTAGIRSKQDGSRGLNLSATQEGTMTEEELEDADKFASTLQGPNRVPLDQTAGSITLAEGDDEV